MASNRNDSYKLNYAQRKFTDDDLDQLPISKHKKYDYQEVDFSMNELTSQGLRKVVNLCLRCPELRVLKLFKNRLDDAAANDLARLVRECPWIEEMHLSHNRFTADGCERIVVAAERSRPNGASPLWLRLEQNNVENAAAVLQDMQARLSVCDRSDEKSCTTHLCRYGRKVHLPFFWLAGGKVKGKGKGKDKDKDKGREAWWHEDGPRNKAKVVLTARTKPDSQDEDSRRDGYDSQGDDDRYDKARPRGHDILTPARNRSDRSPRVVLRSPPPQRDQSPSQRRVRRRDPSLCEQRDTERGHPMRGERLRVLSAHDARQADSAREERAYERRRRPRSLGAARMVPAEPKRRRLTDDELGRLRDRDAEGRHARLQAPRHGQAQAAVFRPPAPPAQEWGAAFNETAVPDGLAVQKPLAIADGQCAASSSGSSSGSSSSVEPPLAVAALANAAMRTSGPQKKKAILTAVAPAASVVRREAKTLLAAGSTAVAISPDSLSDDDASSSEDGEPAGVALAAGSVASPKFRATAKKASAPQPWAASLQSVNRSAPFSVRSAVGDNTGPPPRAESPSPSCSETRWQEDRGCSPPALASPGRFSRSRSRGDAGGEEENRASRAGQARYGNGGAPTTGVKARMETLKERLTQKWQGKQAQAR